MADLNAALLKLFEELRQQGVPLGVSDYLDAIAAMQAGLGLEDPEQFKQLLRLLWTKSQEDQVRFESLFDNLFDPIWQAIETKAIEAVKITAETSIKSGEIPSIGLAQPVNQPATGSSQDAAKSEQEGKQKTVPLPQPQPSQFFSHSSSPHHYQLIPYFPLSQREMAGAWRQLRRPQRIGVPTELDVEGTIDQLACTGSLVRPVLRPRRRNLSRLVVLIDRQGSMTPFHPWIDAALDSILRGGLLGRASFYYFHNCPSTFLYRQPDLTGIVRFETVLAEQVSGSSVLIISDAGAAKGYFDSLRVADTEAFLHKLHDHTYLYAWINPMPKPRWRTTSAEKIARLVPMFPLDREGLNDAVNILRGQPFPVGVGLHEPD